MYKKQGAMHKLYLLRISYLVRSPLMRRDPVIGNSSGLDGGSKVVPFHNLINIGIGKLHFLHACKQWLC